ncbi:MAG TPA: hypothetical protein VFV49_18515, partial [Thermoanaerobaculia bacterium]|nr:hypothetical protein [Thermoanaerobaculia bacterium]
MSPRITALARLAIVVLLTTLVPLAAQAQTCPQPTIFAEPDVCPGSSAYAAVDPPPPGTEYTAYSWSVVNGTPLFDTTSSSFPFQATGAGDVELTVTVTDGNGCQATNSTIVPLATIPPPQINLNMPSVCPGSGGMSGYATTGPAPEGITYQTYQWSIVNGAILMGATDSSVAFTVDGSAPAQLTLTVTDTGGCHSTNSVTVPVRTIPPPEIYLYTPSVCPGSGAMGGYATVATPPEGITYQSYQWSIVNGAILMGSTDSSVAFTVDGSAPAELTLTVTDSYGCHSTNSTTVQVRTIPPPEIYLYTPSVCPGSGAMGGYATVGAPQQQGVTYQSYAWSITNGTIMYGANSSSVSFTMDGSAPAELTLTVMDSYGCYSTNSTTVGIRTIPPPE